MLELLGKLNLNFCTFCKSACFVFFVSSPLAGRRRRKQRMEEAPGTKFKTPLVFDNPTGWGPTEDSIPQKFIDLPYAPFSKGDKLGKVADLSGYSAKYSRGAFPLSSMRFLSSL